MAYLVKESFTAAPKQCMLEGIRSEHTDKLLAGTAMIREERQDFWYSVAELVGETPAREFQFACPNCRAITEAREIDVGLQVPCQKCQALILAPDIKPVKDPGPDRPLLRRGNLLLIVGAVILCSQFIDGHISKIVSAIGICMMINGYGKRSLFYQKHPTASSKANPVSTPPA